MGSAEGSFYGLAKQTAKGTPNTTDASFKYLLFNEGGISPNNMILPLDPEVGGGALIRNVQKVGVTAGGALSFIPRPATLGMFLNGLLNDVSTVDNADGSYTHTFTLGSDHFAAPYYTVRSAPGNLWGEQHQDVRVTSLALSWRGANFVRGQVGLIGGLPAKVSTAAWNALTYVDGGPQFIAPLGDIELPSATDIKVLGGSFVAAAAIPLDEQMIVGSYSPDDLDIVSKSFMIQMAVKISDGDLYTKMMIDPDGGNAWVAEIFKEADFKLEFSSDQEAASGVPYKISIAANGENQASGDANVAWSAQPVSVRAGRNLIMNVTGTFLADPLAGDPISVELTNQTASY
jgi:hypothetical protein